MILQQIAIEKSEYSHMYFRGGEVRENALFVKGGERASLDTYFNSFPYTKYSEYTRVKNVVFKCNVSGRAEIALHPLVHSISPRTKARDSSSP